MKFTERDFIPLIFANDINVYSVVRAFYEKYNVKCYVYGKAVDGPCKGSKLLEFTANPNCDKPDVLLKIVNDFANKHKDKKILTVGCGDNYVRSISQNLGKFADNVYAPYTECEILEKLQDKDYFYKLCDEYGILYPKTYTCTMAEADSVEPGFDAPYILKPADGVMYFANPFEGQKKVFRLDTKEELLSTLKKIYASGYTKDMIIQEFIPGDDTYMRVLTCYSDWNGKVKLMALGHVLLEEHTPYGIGNHAVIMNEYNEELMMQFKKFLEGIKFKGFSNFDIKYDRRNNTYKVFEINTRQGRSNFYVTGAGHNIAEYLVENFMNGKPLEEKLVKNEHLWLVVPKITAFQNVSQPEYKKAMRKLFKEGKYVNPMRFSEDNDFGRWWRVTKSQFGQYVRFKKYKSLGK